MTESPNTSRGVEPPGGVARALRNAWSTVQTVYWANSVSWRALKAGGLLFFGFFLWAGSNVLRSYTGWGVLDYTAAYGFVVLWYGPLHHLAVIPLALRWRRASGVRQRVGKRLPNAMLAAFLVAVLVLGTAPAGLVTVDFASAMTGASTAGAQPELSCAETPNGDAVACEVTNAERVDRVVVTTGGSAELRALDDPPFEFTVQKSEVAAMMDRKQFTVHVYDADGDLLRQYTHRL